MMPLFSPFYRWENEGAEDPRQGNGCRFEHQADHIKIFLIPFFCILMPTQAALHLWAFSLPSGTGQKFQKWRRIMETTWKQLSHEAGGNWRQHTPPCSPPGWVDAEVWLSLPVSSTFASWDYLQKIPCSQIWLKVFLFGLKLRRPSTKDTSILFFGI